MNDFTVKYLKSFSEWLTARGASILINNTEYEVLRFKTTSKGVSVLYRRKNGHFTMTGEMERAWRSFKDGKSFDLCVKTTKRIKKTSSIIATLLKRDGENCFYCNKLLYDDFYSIEHLLSISHGGSNHISNLVLAHTHCNKMAGTLSVIEKIKIRESNLTSLYQYMF